MRAMATVLALGTAAVLAGTTAQGRVILEDGFTTASRSGNDIQSAVTWFTYSPAESVINPGTVGAEPVLKFTDTANSNSGYAQHNLGGEPAFNTGTVAADAVVTFSVDMKVDSYVTNEKSHAFRFIVRDGSRTNNNFVVGFSHTTFVGTDKPFLYAGEPAGTSSLYTPTTADAIGWNAGSSTWATGFDFGNYSTTNAASNDTNGGFYRLQITFNAPAAGLQAIDIKATELSTGNTATLTKNTTTPYVFSNIATDFLTLYAPYNGSGVASFDNVKVNVVPEPTAASIIGLGGLALLRRTRH